MNHEKIKEEFEKVAKSHGYCITKNHNDVYINWDTIHAWWGWSGAIYMEER